MQVLDIVDQARNQIARVTHSSEDGLSVQIINPDFKDELEAFLRQAETEGVTMIIGGASEKDGNTIFTTEKIMVSLGEQLFLPALADALRKVKMSDQRVFGVLNEAEVTQ